MINSEPRTNANSSPEHLVSSPSGPGNGKAVDRWHESAPARVRRAFRSGDPLQGWAMWTEHLAERREIEPPAKRLTGKSDPLTWALPDDLDAAAMAQRLAAIDVLGRNRKHGDSADEAVRQWLSAPADPLVVAYALESLAWARGLPGLSRCIAQPTWWSLLDHLCATAKEAGQSVVVDAPLARQLLAGELPLTLAYMLPEISACRELLGPARQVLSTSLEDLLDGEGLPDGVHLGVFRSLIACWTRCRAIGGRGRNGLWNHVAESHYRWVVRAALRLTRRDGSQVLSDGSAGQWCKDLFDNLLDLGGDETDRDIAARILPGTKKNAKRTSRSRLPKPAAHSEWAAVSVLNCGWDRKEPRLVAVYPGTAVDVELSCRSDIVFSGRWALDVRLDGEPLQPQTDWEVVCWHSDSDVDYLELEVSLGEKARVQRHLLLAREDRVLMLADAVLGEARGRLEYCGTLPVAQGIRFQPAGETREGLLVGKKPRALVLPLALPEWRCDGRPGTLATADRGLELRQSADGSALFAPLFFDLETHRMNRPFTWRQLAVAENLEVLADDAAVGYRAMVGKKQWLIYRTLREVGNRTVLGHNLVSQMLVAEFGRDGEIDPLLEIE